MSTPEDIIDPEPSYTPDPPIPMPEGAKIPPLVDVAALEGVADGFKTGVDPDLEELFTKYSITTEELKFQARKLVDLSAMAVVSKMAGVDTSVAEGSIQAAFLNLKAAGGIRFADDLMKTMHRKFAQSAALLISFL